MDDWNAHVRPHGPLQELAPNLWQVTGVGRPLDRTMVIWRMPDGGLWLHSAVALTDAGMQELDLLGPVRVMVAPNRYHRMDCAVYKARYPSAKLVAPRAARSQVEKVAAVDADAEDFLPACGIRVHVPRGTRPGELVYEVPLNDGAALVCADLLFNIPDAGGGFHGFVLKHVTLSVGPLGVSRIFRLLVLQDRAVYADWVASLGEIPSLRVLSVAHGLAITDRVGDALRTAATGIRNRVRG